MSIRRGNHFVLYMFQQDLENMTNWVLQYPNKETGGDLFGLWSGEGDNAVIHVVLGPGRGCTHGDYHFYQDVNYLEKVGNLLTENYMLGHIGEWHSHHKLQLDCPSEGDCSTIQRNFPQGSCGFFLMIANIYDGDQVSFSPYIFNENSGHCRAGYVEKIAGKSPFRLIRHISQELDDGKEAEKAVASIEGRKLSSNPSSSATSPRGTYTTSTVYKKFIMPVIPSRPSFQWYSKKENHAVIEDIYRGLGERVGEIEFTFDEDYMKNMNMNFVHHKYNVSLSFPDDFPLFSARILVNKKCRDLILLKNCFTFQSFNLNEFLEAVLQILQTLS